MARLTSRCRRGHSREALIESGVLLARLHKTFSMSPPTGAAAASAPCPMFSTKCALSSDLYGHLGLTKLLISRRDDQARTWLTAKRPEAETTTKHPPGRVDESRCPIRTSQALN